jgi:tRNA/rRNA methyltransferase
MSPGDRRLRFVFATTARGRELVKPVVTPERAMAMARALAAEGKRVGVLFGPERAGLENDDIIHANAIVTVPVNPDFPSLNLAQCVLLLGYEWQRQGVTCPPGDGTGPDRACQPRRGGPAGRSFRGTAGGGGVLLSARNQGRGMKANLRNMWGRLGLTRAEVQTFHGMLRQIAWKLKNGGE